MFKEAIKESCLRLEAVRQKDGIDAFAVIGGFAVACWGIARATADIDYIIKLGEMTLEELARELNGKYRIGKLDDPLAGSVSFEIHRNEIVVPVQLLQFPLAWENVAFNELTHQAIDDTHVPFVDWKALILLKLYAASPLDLEDARKVLSLRKPKKKELDYLVKKAQALRVSRRLERIMEK